MFAGNGDGSTIANGRWPSNVMLDEYTASLVDEQSGVSKSGMPSKHIEYGNGTDRRETPAHMPNASIPNVAPYGDYGGASRFFYVAKASKRDRNEGLDGLPKQNRYQKGGVGGTGGWRDVEKAQSATPVQNFHPTVKPTELMRNLIRLVTPLGGTVLDPFTGSGSTGKAAILEGMQFVGCELTPEYLPIIEGRINYAVSVKEQELLAEDEKLF
jgi:site-specific DNA-methyltransferase (adenine-specific)